MGAGDKHLPLIPGQKLDMRLPVRSPAGMGFTEAECPSVTGVMKYLPDAAMKERSPGKCILVWACSHPPWEL